MAMNFSMANRAENPDLLQATIEQGRIASQLRQAEMANKQGYITSGATLAQAVPEGAWANLGNAMMGGETAAAGAGAADAAAAATAAEAAAGAGAAGTTAAGTTAGTAAGTAAGAGAAGTGVGGALAALGPVGWAALAALALGAAS